MISPQGIHWSFPALRGELAVVESASAAAIFLGWADNVAWRTAGDVCQNLALPPITHCFVRTDPDLRLRGVQAACSACRAG
ncbi:hypothetical protein CUJ84_pRLN3000304 (plasmid) [Rhizobium leguminosarum]|uniref:Uncharacterized protein n=1 Tax=Rhizobium leguminosarum TaxID=384 RepID=A0A2K9ZGT2_RHILE|nr:hypothetical protein CUJ84_pRLN3000304 [Rhizobium leguminosarum]